MRYDRAETLALCAEARGNPSAEALLLMLADACEQFAALVMLGPDRAHMDEARAVVDRLREDVQATVRRIVANDSAAAATGSEQEKS